MNLPTEKECLRLFDVFHTPENVIRHSRQVARIAVFLAKQMRIKGHKVNINLVQRAALLHDLFKFIDFPELSQHSRNIRFSNEVIKEWRSIRDSRGAIEHDAAASDYLRPKYPELARVIIAHGYGRVKDVNCASSWEEKIVTYADKRVLHDRIVSLSERFIDGKKRYGQEQSETRDIDNHYYSIEQEICAQIGVAPEEIEGRL
jgi:uncharacterized protein